MPQTIEKIMAYVIGKNITIKIKINITKNLVKKLKNVDVLTTSDFLRSDS